MRALVIDHIHPAGVELLSHYMDVDHLSTAPSSQQLAEIIEDYHAVMMRVTPAITRETLRRARSLQVISVASVGLDHIDLVATAEAGISVINQPGVNRNSVAEFTFGLIISLTRMIPSASDQLRQGLWNRNGFQNGIELSGRTLGIIGLGHTGTRVAEIAQGFQMRTLAYSPYTSDYRAHALGIPRVSLNDLLAESDIITVHCPLNPQTRNMIGYRELHLMKPESYLLNLARGGIVDESALYQALKSGHLAGAASDVFTVEPPGAHPLLQLPNFLGTPHIAGPTRDTLWRASMLAAEAVIKHAGVEVEDLQRNMSVLA